MLLLGIMLAIPLIASIEDQRLRLPPPATVDDNSDCSDPVVGVWLGQHYNPRSISWQKYRLHIRRVSPGSTALVGEVRVLYWTGAASLVVPPADCQGVGLSAEILQNATGTVVNNFLSFGGNDWRAGQVFCGSRGSVAYNPDHFQGLINVGLQEFQSVNNDGGTAVNEPVVFRRIECAQRTPQPNVTVVLPTTEPLRTHGQRRRGLSAIFNCSRQE